MRNAIELTFSRVSSYVRASHVHLSTGRLVLLLLAAVALGGTLTGTVQELAAGETVGRGSVLSLVAAGAVVLELIRRGIEAAWDLE